MSEYYYHGYWFFGLRNNEIIRAKDLTEEYCLLNCPQEYVGPFPTRFEAWQYQDAHPHASEEFHQMLKDMEEFMTSGTNAISMDNRRQYTYSDNSAKATFSPENGLIGTYTGYPFQVVNIQPNDVILLKIADNLSLRECQMIQKEMNETFPNNTVVLCNDHVLKGITVLRGETEKVNDTVNIQTTVDVNKLFEEIMRGNPNDFLY